MPRGGGAARIPCACPGGGSARPAEGCRARGGVRGGGPASPAKLTRWGCRPNLLRPSPGVVRQAPPDVARDGGGSAGEACLPRESNAVGVQAEFTAAVPRRCPPSAARRGTRRRGVGGGGLPPPRRYRGMLPCLREGRSTVLRRQSCSPRTSSRRV